MAGSLDVDLKLAPSWRNVRGRFAKAGSGGELEQAVKTWSAQTVAALKAASPVEETGRLRAGWTATYLPLQKAAEIRNPVQYVSWVVNGTAQSTGGFIYPIHGKFLRFMAKQGPHAGKIIYKQRVRGQKPNPALNAVIDGLAEDAAVDLSKAGSAILQRLGGEG